MLTIALTATCLLALAELVVIFRMALRAERRRRLLRLLRQNRRERARLVTALAYQLQVARAEGEKLRDALAHHSLYVRSGSETVH